jgi:hypothetical protein
VSVTKRTNADSDAGKPQAERFKQAARELECDDDPERFAERVRKIAKAPPAPKGKAVKLRKGQE